jgi:drug/metabolite transporter (DMT)-like permease
VALILIQKLDISIPPLFSLFITASIASLYFNLINRKHFKKIYMDCFNNKIKWLLVMLIVLIMWGTTMIGPGKIGASLFNFIYFAWLGMLGLMALSFKNWEKYKIKFYFGICLFFLIIASAFLEFQSSSSYQTLYGISLALIGGTSSFIYFKNSQSLAKSADLSATQILAVRFYLSIIILFIIIPKHHVVHYITFGNIVILALLALLSLIIPLYFSQKALEKISSEQHAIINSLCPIVTGVLQQVTFNDLKNEQMIIYFLYTVSIVCFYFITKYKNKAIYR